MKKEHKFSIEKIEILNEKGKVNSKLMPKLSKNKVLQLYSWMRLIREFDRKSLALQRTGKIGTYASMLGQEGTIVGSTSALRKQDWLFPSYRMSGGMIVKGARMDQLFLYWGGDERGMSFKKGINVFPIAIPVASQTLHATGFSWGAKIESKDLFSLVDFGDGATSKGDFHEAMNFAGAFNLPVIFLCQNNQYAISTPLKEQTASPTIAQKAIAYGIEGVQVDGNDIFAVYKVVNDAIKKKKPILVEALTYRMEDHTTSDDAKKYRSLKEKKRWEIKDPLLRLRLYLESKKWWNKNKESKLVEKVQIDVKKAVQKYLKTKPPKREDMFNYLFAKKEK